MATKNPMENYLKGEREIDSSVQSLEGKQPYEMSRRGFLKGAVALTGAAIFGEGFLKQMEAWAEDGVVVYVNPICIVEGTDSGRFENMIARRVESALSKRGIKLTARPENADIEIDLSMYYKGCDSAMFESIHSPYDSVTITARYIKADGFTESVTFPKTNSVDIEPYIEETIGNAMANYLIFGEKTKLPKILIQKQIRAEQ